jgi:hypothetical protein
MRPTKVIVGVLIPPPANKEVKEKAAPKAKKRKERTPSPPPRAARYEVSMNFRKLIYNFRYDEEEDLGPKTSRRSKPLVEDEGNEDFYESNYSSLIQNMFRRGRRGGYDSYDDEDDMEARFDDIENEEDFR